MSFMPIQHTLPAPKSKSDLARLLMMQNTPDYSNIRHPLEGLGKMSQQLLNAYTMKKGFDAEQKKQDNMNVLISEALQAGQARPSYTDEATGITWNEQKSNPNLTAQLLMNNPDTAQMGQTMALNRMQSAQNLEDEIAKMKALMPYQLELARAKAAAGAAGNPPAAMQVTNRMMELSQIYNDPNASERAKQEAKAEFNFLHQNQKSFGIDRGMNPSMPVYGEAPVMPQYGGAQPNAPQAGQYDVLDQALNSIDGQGGGGQPMAQTGVSAVPGFADVNAGIKAQQKSAEKQAEKNVELDMNPQIKRAETQAVNEENRVANIRKEQDQAVMDLPKMREDAAYTKSIIDKIKQHPGMTASVGLKNPFKGAFPLGMTAPGSPAAGFRALTDQLKGQQFMVAYDTLKGGGVITEIEGEKATAAKARLDTAQSEEEYIGALDELASIIDMGLQRAERMAVDPMHAQKPPVAPSNNDYQGMSDDDLMRIITQ